MFTLLKSCYDGESSVFCYNCLCQQNLKFCTFRKFAANLPMLRAVLHKVNFSQSSATLGIGLPARMVNHARLNETLFSFYNIFLVESPERWTLDTLPVKPTGCNLA
jgi:hypothetical protein